MAETKRETVQPKGPGRGPRAHVDLKSIDWKQTVSTLKRLMSMIWKNYATLLIIVIIALFASSLVSVAANQGSSGFFRIVEGSMVDGLFIYFGCILLMAV